MISQFLTTLPHFPPPFTVVVICCCLPSLLFLLFYPLFPLFSLLSLLFSHFSLYFSISKFVLASANERTPILGASFHQPFLWPISFASSIHISRFYSHPHSFILISRFYSHLIILFPSRALLLAKFYPHSSSQHFIVHLFH